MSASCASTCWVEGLGSAVSPATGLEYRPTLELCEASNINWGRYSSHGSAAVRRRLGQPLEIVALGASITCGSHVANLAFGGRDTRRRHRDGTRGDLTAAWPAQLELALRSCWGDGAARVRNECSGARGSDFFMEAVAAGQVNLSTADVVIIETASNDNEQYVQHEGGAGRGESGIAGYVETLARLLLALPRRPFVLWLTAGWRGFEYGRAESAEETHLRVTRHLGVPHLSLLSALQPVDHDEETVDLTTHALYQDCCHPSRLGHKIIASLVAHRLTRQLEMAAARGAAATVSSSSSSSSSPPPPSSGPSSGGDGGSPSAAAPQEAAGASDEWPFAAAPWVQQRRERRGYTPSFLSPFAALLVSKLLPSRGNATAVATAVATATSTTAADAVAAADSSAGGMSGGSRPPAPSVLRLDFSSAAAANASFRRLPMRAVGFAHGSGWGGDKKLGLIGDATRGEAACDVLLIELPRHATQALVSFIHSYHHMGLAELRVLSSDPSPGGGGGGCGQVGVIPSPEAAVAIAGSSVEGSATPAQPHEIGSSCAANLTGASSMVAAGPAAAGLATTACKRVDLLWPISITTPRSAHLDLGEAGGGGRQAGRHAAQGRGHHRACRWLSIAAVPSVQGRGRASNQVILSAVTLF